MNGVSCKFKKKRGYITKMIYPLKYYNYKIRYFATFSSHFTIESITIIDIRHTIMNIAQQ